MSKPLASELMMDENSAAAALLLSVRTLQRWRGEGRGPKFVKLGKRVFYTRAALEKTVADAERQSTSR
jgi:Helix-turn-helix domain